MVFVRNVDFESFTNATVGGVDYPFLGMFFVSQWLGVTRASDPPVPCGHRLSFVRAVFIFRD